MIQSDLHGNVQSTAEMTVPPRIDRGSNNANGPKVTLVAHVSREAHVVLGCMLEHLSIRRYSVSPSGEASENPSGADNQQGSRCSSRCA